MCRCLFAAFIVCCVSFQGWVRAEDKPTKAMVAVGELNEAYVTAFNAQDSEKLAACFGESSDFTLLTGDSISGREKVQAAHQSFFKNNPGAKIKGKQQTYRTIRPGVVLASGIWEVTDGPSEYPPSGLWFTVLARQEGQWQYEAMRLMIPAKAK